MNDKGRNEAGNVDESKNNVSESKFYGDEESNHNFIHKNQELLSKISKEDINIVKMDTKDSFLKLNEMLEISEEIIDSDDKDNGFLSKISQEDISIVKMDVNDSYLKFNELETSEEMIKYYDKGTEISQEEVIDEEIEEEIKEEIEEEIKEEIEEEKVEEEEIEEEKGDEKVEDKEEKEEKVEVVEEEKEKEEKEEEEEEEKEKVEENISVKMEGTIIFKSIETLNEIEDSDQGENFSYTADEEEENFVITKAQELSKEKVSNDVKKNLDNKYTELKEIIYQLPLENNLLDVKERNMEMSHNEATVIENTSIHLFNKHSNTPPGASRNNDLHVDLITPNTTFESADNRSLGTKDNNSTLYSHIELSGVCPHHNCTKLGLILSIMFFFVGYFLHNYIQISISSLSSVTNKPKRN